MTFSRIKFHNLEEQYKDTEIEIMAATNEVFAGGQYFNDDNVMMLQSLISSKYNLANVVATNSGTSALTVALLAEKLPQGGLVAIPAMTYVATANAVRAAGLFPICIDIDDHWLMDFNELERYVTKFDNLSAVVVVDLYGQGVDLKKFHDFCKLHKLKLIVDAAQSFEMKYVEYNQIDYCDSLALSFNPLKNFGCMGNAGAVVSKQHEQEYLYSFCVQGKGDSDIVNPGLNCRIDEVQAAILNQKYPYYDYNITTKLELASYYRQLLSNYVVLPDEATWCTHMNYVFPIKVENMENTKTMLSLYNIETGCHYEKPIHHYTAYKTFRDFCPRATELAGKIISLPLHWHMKEAQAFTVIENVIKSL